MKPAAAAPRVLLVEDDPVSRAFLVEALATAAEVVAVEDARGALRAAGRAPGFDLWLLDAHLPDGDGIALLRLLRALAPATPALAHTADPDPALAHRLHAAGFAGVLPKPLSARLLRTAIGRATGRSGGHIAEAPGAAWQPALRRMFLAELPGQRAAVRAALSRGDGGAAQALLHRLRGSCALVGAHELDAAVRGLQASPGSASALATFDRAVAVALRMQDPAQVGEQVP